MSVLDELQAAVAAVETAVSPSVVGIGRRVRGTGFVLESGHVVTNAHNLRGEEVTVHLPGGSVRTGTVVGVDADGDLAVIAVDTGSASPAAWDAEAAATGTPVFGVAALPGGGARVTFGLVSSVERSFRGPGGHRIEGSIEHTAPLAPGSSGGPLVDGQGRLVGINTNRIGDAFYLALPADAALRERLAALARGESAPQPRLGIAIAPSFVALRLRRSVGLPDRDGVLVRAVDEDSPAAAAGIAEGDLIIQAGGRAIADADDLHAALRATGFPIELVLVRGAEERTVRVEQPAG